MILVTMREIQEAGNNTNRIQQGKRRTKESEAEKEDIPKHEYSLISIFMLAKIDDKSKGVH